MPRGGRSRPMSSGGSAGPPRSFSSTGYAPRSPSPPPPNKSAPQHPGLMKQAAATAGGVVAGNMISSALMGPRTTVVVTEQQEKQPEDPCAKQIQDLLNCLKMIQETNENITICEGFRLKLAECRKQYGDPYSGQQQQQR